MPFKHYDLMCPKCGSELIQGEGARQEGYYYHCMKCGYGSWNRGVFKKERVMQMKRWKNIGGAVTTKTKKEKIMSDGWHKYNPHNAKCDCGSSDVEFLWDNGEVHGFHCNTCGETELDK